jgi:6-phosphofructokinase 2
MDEELAEVVKGGPTIVKPSRRELASLVDRLPAGDDALERAGREVLARGVAGALVVSLGPAGAALLERDGPTTWFTPPPVEVVSTVGCGDTMVAGIVCGLAEGRSLTDAVRLGVAAGTGTATMPGTKVADGALARRLEPRVVVGDAPPRQARS